MIASAQRSALVSASAWAGGAAALLAALLYTFTSTSAVVPGEAAVRLAEQLGLGLLPAGRDFAWGHLVRLLGPAAARWIGVLAGAWCAGLIALLAARRLRDRIPSTAAAGLGLLGALLFLTCPPVWIAATRTLPHLFDLALAATAYAAISAPEFARSRNARVIAACALIPLLQGASPAAWCALPLLIWAAVLLGRRALTLLLPVLAGTALLWLLEASALARDSFASWSGLWGDVGSLRAMGLRHLEQGRHFFQTPGWIVAAAGCGIPFLLMEFIHGRGKRLPRLHDVNLLPLFYCAAALTAVWAGSPLAPWERPTQAAWVLPCWLAALAFPGALGHCWSVLRPGTSAGLRRLVDLTPFLLLIPVILMAWARVERCSARAAAMFQPILRAVLEETAEGAWVLTDARFDSLLRLAAQAGGRPIECIDIARLESREVRRALVLRLGRPDLAPLAEIGRMPLLVAWLGGVSERAHATVIAPGPDLWITAGCEVQPGAFGFRRAGAGPPPDPETLGLKLVGFQDQVGPTLQALQETTFRDTAREMALHFARVANDTGVYLENVGAPTAARQAYLTAIRHTPLQPSASANLAAMARDLGSQAEIASASNLLRAASDRWRGELKLSDLSSRFGHVRTRAALQALESEWRQRGRTLARAGESPPAVEDAMAALAAGRLDEARSLLEAGVRDHPDAESAWSLLARIALAAGDRPLLARCFTAMRRDDDNWSTVLEVMGRFAEADSDVEQALRYYRESLRAQPQQPELLARIIELELAGGRQESAIRHLDQLLSIEPGGTEGPRLLGDLLLLREERALAEQAYRTQLRKSSDVRARLALVQLLMDDRRLDEAWSLIRVNLEQAPERAECWAQAGRLQLLRGQADTAIAALMQAEGLEPRHEEVRLLQLEVMAARGEVPEARRRASDWLRRDSPRDSGRKRRLEVLQDPAFEGVAR